MDTHATLDRLLNAEFGDAEGIVSAFRHRYGVSVKKGEKSDLFLFQYTPNSDWSSGIAQQCRGCVFLHREADCRWERVSRPFDKFFNAGEPECSLDFGALAAHPEQFRLTEKADGTCIQYFLAPSGRWIASTLGVNPGHWESDTYEFGREFAGAVSSLSGSTMPAFTAALDPAMTYVFELCTPRTHVLTTYDSLRVYFLAARMTASPRDPAAEDRAAEAIVASNPWLSVPKAVPCTSLKSSAFSGVETLHAAIEELGATGLFGEGIQVPEGFVLFHGREPVAKLKLDQYIALLARRGNAAASEVPAIRLTELTGQVLQVELLRAILTDTADDQLARATPEIRQIADTVREVVNAEVGKVEAVCNRWASRSSTERKRGPLKGDVGKKTWSTFVGSILKDDCPAKQYLLKTRVTSSQKVPDRREVMKRFAAAGSLFHWHGLLFPKFDGKTEKKP